MDRFFRFLVASCVLSCCVGCTVDSAKSHYLLAEKLWNDRKYSSAISEFEKVISKDPKGKLGIQALYRSAMTQAIFLSQYNDAVRKFRDFIQVSTDSRAIWETQIQIGEILFSKTEQYDQAIIQYRSMIQQKPNDPLVPEFFFRIGKSQFFLFQFSEAINTYKELINQFPNSEWSEKGAFEIGATYFTRGEQQSNGVSQESEPYQDAINAYESFIKRYPSSKLISEARFGIACCYEELDRLDDAYQIYKDLKTSYPSPSVIEIKLIRIRERIAQRNNSR